MTRKHYQLIADTISRAIQHENGNTTKIAAHRRDAARDMAYAFCASLRDTNPRFDSTKFLVACFKGTEFEL